MWQHVQLSEQIRPRDTLACCWGVKQAANQQWTAYTLSVGSAGEEREGGSSWMDLAVVNVQSLEFVAETRILAEMKIKNHRKIARKAYFFSMKFRRWICECKLKVQNWYSSWILLCYISSNLLPECLKLHRLSIFSGGGWGGRGVGHASDPPRNFLLFFPLAIPDSDVRGFKINKPNIEGTLKCMIWGFRGRMVYLDYITHAWDTPF